MKTLNLKLNKYRIRLLINILNKEITVLENTELEINKNELLELIETRKYLTYWHNRFNYNSN